MKIHEANNSALFNIEYIKHYILIAPLDLADKVLLVKEEDNYKKLLFLLGIKIYTKWKYQERLQEWERLGDYNLTQTKQQDT